MAKAIILGPGNPCPKCRRLMERRRPPAGKPVVYAYWDYCKPCGHLQHYHEARLEGEQVASMPIQKVIKPLVSPGYAIVGGLYDPAQDDGSLPW